MNRKFYAFPGFCLAFLLLLLSAFSASAQRGKLHWAADGYQYYSLQSGGLVELDTRDSAKKTVVLTRQMLTPAGGQALGVEDFSVSRDGQKVLLFTNSKRVWRYNTRGDYWIYDLAAKTLKQIGKDRP